MDFKLAYIGKGNFYIAYIYEIENYYVYVIESNGGTLSGPSTIYDSLKPIEARMKLEEPKDYDENKEKLAERLIQKKYDVLKRKIDFENQENLNKFNI